MGSSSQEKTLDVQRGLFLVKYDSSESANRPPRVSVAPDAESENALELILSPDSVDATLWSPGASLVVRAVDRGRLKVVVEPAEPNGSTAARVSIAVLSDDPLGARESGLSPAALDLSNFRVLGHVAGIGDVTVSADDWVGGPLAPSRIEGMAIQWPDKPRDIDLRYAVTVGGPSPRQGQFVSVGSFAGTRGRALPVVGATLEISGSAATTHQLRVDTIFLGSPQMTVAGARVVLAGPTGREPLVGLRIVVEPIDAVRANRPTAQPGVSQKPSRAGASARTPQAAGKENQTIHKTSTVARGRAAAAPDADIAESQSSGATAQSLSKRGSRVRVFRSAARSKAR